MFFAEDRLPIVQQMIWQSNCHRAWRRWTKLLPVQKEDFIGLFREMSGIR